MELIFTRKVPFEFSGRYVEVEAVATVNVSVDPYNPYEIHVDCTYNGKTAENLFTSDDELVTKQQVVTLVDRNGLIQEAIWELVDILEEGALWDSEDSLEVK